MTSIKWWKTLGQKGFLRMRLPLFSFYFANFCFKLLELSKILYLLAVWEILSCNLTHRPEKNLQISRQTKGSEAYVKHFNGYSHLVAMLFGILKHFDSLRELEIGMKAEAHKLSHLGIDHIVRRSTLAGANIRRPQEFFASVYSYLLEKYAKFLANSNNLQKNHPNECFGWFFHMIRCLFTTLPRCPTTCGGGSWLHRWHLLQ